MVLLRASKPAERQKKQLRGRDQCEPRQPHALEAPPYAPGSSSPPASTPIGLHHESMTLQRGRMRPVHARLLLSTFRLFALT